MGTRGDRIKEGYLKKLPPLSRNPSRKDFKKRWFVLWESCHLAYYTKKGGEVLKEINLNTCTSVKGNYRESNAVRDAEYALFLKTPSRDWLFVADNQDEMQAWVDAIQALVRVSRGEPPPVQPRPLETLTEDPRPTPDSRPPASLPSPTGRGSTDEPDSIVHRPLPAPPDEIRKPHSMSTIQDPRQPLPHGHGHHLPTMPGYPSAQTKSMSLPHSARKGQHHNYVNTDKDLQRPMTLSSHQFPHPPSRTFTPTGLERGPQLDDPHYVMFHKGQNSGQSPSQDVPQLNKGYVNMTPEEHAKLLEHSQMRDLVHRDKLSNMKSWSVDHIDSRMQHPSGHHQTLGGMSHPDRVDFQQFQQWSPFGDEPKSVHSYVNMSGDQIPPQVPPQVPPRSFGH